jgi:poly(3-hydroxybutyrate) depolymerase
MARWTALFGLIGCADADPIEDAELCVDDACVHAGSYGYEGPDGARDVVVYAPDEIIGAPVIFVWHHLGGSPDELLRWMPVHDAVADGFVVVAPKSRGLWGSEWDLSTAPDDNVDVALFDDLVDDLVAQGADPGAIYATGFSAGGLFTTFLTMHRADRLAATAPFSGGAPSSDYVAPATDLPVMVSWGGSSDVFAGFDFDAASRNLVTSLGDDGHVVLECDHGLGHWLPDDAAERVRAFFRGHVETGGVGAVEGCVRRDP